MLSKKLNTRHAVNKWIEYANKIHDMEVNAYEVHHSKLIKKKREALEKLREYSRVSNADKERDNEVMIYLEKKRQYRLISTLKLATKLLQRRRLNLIKSAHFRKWQLQKKAIYCFAVSVQRTRTFRLLTH
jgi:hypothetical protein